MKRIRSCGAMLITAPTETERLYEMAVRLTPADLAPLVGYTVAPWLRIRANVDTGEVTVAAGVKAKRVDS